MLVVHNKAQQDRQSAGNVKEDLSCIVLPQQFSCLNRPEVFKPFFIILIFCLLQILSGSYIVIFYGVNLISSASGSEAPDLNSMTVAVMTAVVRFIMSIVTTVSLFRLGRRKIGIISGVGTAISCLLLVFYLELKKRLIIEIDDNLNTAVIGCLIMTYVALNAFGIFGLPCMMLGEVLPSTVRGFISGILIMFINLLIFSTTKLYPYAARVLGPSGIFFCFAIVAIFTTLYMYLFLPETKGRPLTQIEQYFATGKNYLWHTRDKTLMARNNKEFA